MTISHTGLKVPAAQHTAIVAWYEAALAPLGYTRAMDFQDGLVVGFADASGAIDWWVTSSAAASFGAPAAEGAAVDGAGILPTHTAFAAKDRAGVEAFHQAAVAAGGKCNGVPGVRAHYGPTYFATFVLDPVGNNIEALCFAAA
ncbi:hypothetical protein CHGG_00141 [Chaetomium globosum CBS 148.51]|uniref:VOC domain-containing protein n=1 Tax=Chaetomium globosum (strain ATCC 6205 / CBS 148.51 / DSM 1962 / NBRC 6347 / NRRL 1970) TaxID=306901 RepID=Q2HI13_CHAGB|nr:uncharacterized protein CHGG_00141 [Chaetomium globosum CBS 148.51]EAQ91906.1 hypothetical protein CHGG_00141 [Chaetomium globosum CBS 148.51]